MAYVMAMKRGADALRLAVSEMCILPLYEISKLLLI